MPGHNILVVDDNAMNLTLLEFVLIGAGYVVKTANHAVEALTILDDWQPRLILVDLQMPGVDGFELTRRLKADPRTAGIVVVAVTAFAMKGDEERARAAGCDGYLSKPISTRALPRQIAVYLGEA